MRLLLLNPNTSVGVTERVVAVARGVAASGTVIEGTTAPRGVPYIATRAEAAIAGAVVLEVLAERQDTYDAAVIAAFGDPGLGGARELFTAPVIGLAEAAMLTACMLGRRFALVSFSATLRPWFEEAVALHGLTGRCAGVRCLDDGFVSIDAVAEEKADRLQALAGQAIAEDGADVIVLAGAPLAGLARIVCERVPVPVVDGVEAAVKQAEALAALRPRKAVAGTYRRPAAKPSTGLPDALARWLGHRE